MSSPRDGGLQIRTRDSQEAVMTDLIETHELEAPGARLAYDVRGDLATGGVPLLTIGSPMDAGGFVTLAGHFPDRTVVTYDPRGTGRTVRTDDRTESTPDDHASDLRHLIEALGVGQVDIFGSSGGAVNALALVSQHPELVRTLVAHEPPVVDQLPDREQLLAVCEDIYRTYQTSGQGPAMAKFIAMIMVQGPLPATYADNPAPDPAMFGLPTEDDGGRDDPLVGQNMRTCPSYVPDYDALIAAPTRIVMGYGEASGEQMPSRAGRAVAARLGLEPVGFPGDHAGFLGGEYGQRGEPDGFAARLREVLSA
jgi:pimeloyl-ACP methyl ester carboxylesterase